jgi:hypothetical protein
MTTSNTAQSVSRRTAFAGLAAGGLGLALSAHGRGVSAQETTSDTMASHPIVGAWKVDNPNIPETRASYAVFHADGIYLEVTTIGGTGIGVWHPTGERTADLFAVFQDLDGDPTKFAPGTVQVWWSLEVDAAGTTFTGPSTVEGRAPDGTVLFTVAGATTGHRLEVEPVPPLGTPTASTPTP